MTDLIMFMEFRCFLYFLFFFFFNDTATTEIYTLSLHDALPISWTAAFRRLHGLAVDDAGRRGALAIRGQARALDQGPIDPRPHPPVAPIVEIMLNRRERRKVFRQGTPLAAGRKAVEDRIHDRAKVNLARTPDLARLRQQRAQQYPLLRCRVACIAKPFAAIYFAGGFGPSHVVPIVESQTRRNHNRARITRLIFGQALRSRPKVGVSKDGDGQAVPAAVLRDAMLRTAPQDEGRGVLFCRRDLISFMESIRWFEANGKGRPRS